MREKFSMTEEQIAERCKVSKLTCDLVSNPELNREDTIRQDKDFTSRQRAVRYREELPLHSIQWPNMEASLKYKVT